MKLHNTKLKIPYILTYRIFTKECFWNYLVIVQYNYSEQSLLLTYIYIQSTKFFRLV